MIDAEKTKELYARAVVTWGAEAQLHMVAEECVELALEVLHYARGKGRSDQIADEVADVEIMLEQLKLMMRGVNPVFDEVVDAFRERKLQRVEQMLDDWRWHKEGDIVESDEEP